MKEITKEEAERNTKIVNTIIDSLPCMLTAIFIALLTKKWLICLTVGIIVSIIYSSFKERFFALTKTKKEAKEDETTKEEASDKIEEKT